MKIIILGNGGAINNGLPYNAFIIDKKILIETPPDIMLSLAREHIPISLIEEIYISHLHGDHCFGFPFLALNLFWDVIKTNNEKRIKLFAPMKAKKYLIDLTEKAVSQGHPLIEWIKKNVDFINITNITKIKMHKYYAKLFKMDHFEETYGFILKDKDENVFSYVADTKWSQNIIDLLKEKPKKIILDLNGEPDDPVSVHLKENEIIEMGFNLVSPETVFYGTHLRYERESQNEKIYYVKPGMEINI